MKTIRRAFHINDAADTGETYTSIEFSDGFGRLLQSRAQAEDILYTSSGLPADQTAPNANLVGQIKGTNDPDNVVVNGFKIYNNKGKVVEQYEPYFDSDYDCSAGAVGCQGYEGGGQNDSVIVSCGPNMDTDSGACAYDADNVVLYLCDNGN